MKEWKGTVRGKDGNGIDAKVKEGKEGQGRGGGKELLVKAILLVCTHRLSAVSPLHTCS